jgi:hypothetical protein
MIGGIIERSAVSVARHLARAGTAVSPFSSSMADPTTSSTTHGRTIPTFFSPVVTDNTNKKSPRFHHVYVHHVSKTVLKHLQENQSQWLVEQGLDRCLMVNSNGTFVLQFPSQPGCDAGRIW